MIFSLLVLFTQAFKAINDDPQSTPSAIPISIPIGQFKKEGDAICKDGKACPIIDDNIENYKPDDQNTYQCGNVCEATNGSFEYNFIGEKFGIYGFRSLDYGSLKLTIDSTTYELNTSNPTNEDYVLLYVSKNLNYQQHNIKIKAIDRQIKLYKLVYWPTLKANRINISQFTHSGNWKIESDQIGGVRYYNVEGGATETLTAQIQCSKIWIYGTKCSWHHVFNLEISGVSASVDEYVSEPKHPDRIDSTLVFESPILPHDNHNLVFKIDQLATLNFVYYLDEPQPTPEAIPISIPFDQFKQTGGASCSQTTNCPTISDSLDNFKPDDKDTYQCGKICDTKTGSFEYTFKGVKFGIFGFRDLDLGKFEVNVDSKSVQINQNSNVKNDYALLYLSDDLSYTTHTVKITGKDNSNHKFYKLVYWPDLKAKRINLTDFARDGNWKIESDGIGGVRFYNQAGNTVETASKLVTCSKIWVYGTRCDWHQTFDLDIGNEIKATINEYVKEPANPNRIDFTPIFESPMFNYGEHNIIFKINNLATLNYIYYLEDPLPFPTPEAVPISISFGQFVLSGDAACTDNGCPAINDKVSDYQPEDEKTYQCGKTCTTTDGSFEYTFTGVKFGIIGFKSPNNGQFNINYDSKDIIINTKSSSDENYVLLYVSEDLCYKPHTVKITGNDKSNHKFYKLVYWPDLNAKRINLTDFDRTGDWRIESDGIGGVRFYNKQHDTVETASKLVTCSKIWVYGTKCDWHQTFDLDIGNEIKATINEYVKEPANPNRIDSTLLFESPLLNYDTHNVTFKIQNLATLNFIYYLDERPPSPTPLAVPISISLDQFEKSGELSFYKPAVCPTNNLDSPTAYNCAAKSIGSLGTLTYTFCGTKFGIIGIYSPNYGKFDIEVDSKVTEVDEYKETTSTYKLVHISDDLPYGNHTVKIKGKGNLFEVYKLVFWPTVNSRRVNITEFTKTGTWNQESDGIGGVRMYANSGGTIETATMNIRCSKIWIYGTKCSWHNMVEFTIGNLTDSFDEHITTNRVDTVLLYDSASFPIDDYTLKFTIKQTATLNFVYYETEERKPEPTPSTIPVSISLDMFERSGDVSFYSSAICPIDDLSSPSAYNCGSKAITGDGKFEYTFRGVMFGIIGFRSPNYGKFDLEFNSETIEINTNNDIQEDYKLLYLSNNLTYDNYTVKISGKGEQIKLYKIIFWPSLTAFRVNITEFSKNGDWKAESDLIGGIREYTNKGGTDETAYKDMRCSKIWVYGTKCPWHGEVTFTIGPINDTFTELYTPGRVDNVLLYDSPNFKYQVNTLSFIIKSTATLNFIYYLDEPPDPTPRPTPEPTPLSDQLPSDCGVDLKRCVYDGKTDGELPYSVTVTINDFIGYHDTENGGGAVRITNAGSYFNGNHFKECTSTHQGGGVYIDIDYDYELPINFDNLIFESCSAKSGGGIYVHSTTEKITATITNCQFLTNVAEGQKSEKLYGGSAVYMMISNCLMDKNLFSKNKGIGGTLKIVDIKSQLNAQKLEKSNDGYSYRKGGFVIVSNSKFEITKDADCSLFFESGNSKTEFKIESSSFTGDLAPNSFHIDGYRSKEQENKIIVERCSFDSDSKSAINLNANNDFAIFVLKNQIFKKNVKVSEKNKFGLIDWKIVVSVSAATLVVLVIVAAIFAVKSKRNDEDKSKIESPLSSSIDEF